MGMPLSRRCCAWLNSSLAFKTAAFSILAAAAIGSHAQMSLPGKFDVSAAGAATYSIPIQVPPGIAGIEPSLALNMNSQATGSNGTMGVGWSLSGLSSITRCPRTLAQDAARGSVTYDANDRFCLDGKRLMVVQGSYGAANSEYRTEIETFTKVTAYGSAPGGGPAYFVVKTNAGLTTEYGNTSDSALEVQGKTPQVIRSWALSKVVDPKGNVLTVTYRKVLPTGGSVPAGLQGQFFGTHHPVRIDYTSNPANGLAAANAVVFDYDYGRTDSQVAYLAGYPSTNYARLTSVTTVSWAMNLAPSREGIGLKASRCAQAVGHACRRPRSSTPPSQRQLTRSRRTFPSGTCFSISRTSTCPCSALTSMVMARATS
jgi:hypothetical protein